nr:hypothetical protein [Pedobacter sp. ASV19]
MNYQEITSEEKIFEALNLPVTAIPDLSAIPEKDREPIMSHYLMIKAIEAINPPDFIADLTDFRQPKYFLWPDIEKDPSSLSGFRFSFNGWTHSYAITSVGARRAFADRERARHFWIYFQHLYESYSVIIPIK